MTLVMPIEADTSWCISFPPIQKKNRNERNGVTTLTHLTSRSLEIGLNIVRMDFNPRLYEALAVYTPSIDARDWLFSRLNSGLQL